MTVVYISNLNNQTGLLVLDYLLSNLTVQAWSNINQSTVNFLVRPLTNKAVDMDTTAFPSKNLGCGYLLLRFKGVNFPRR